MLEKLSPGTLCAAILKDRADDKLLLLVLLWCWHGWRLAGS